MATRAILADEFESFLQEREYAVVLFDASWDVASKKKFQPRFEAASEIHSDRVVFGEIDCDALAEVARSIPVLNVPTVVYYRRGRPVATLVGFQDVAAMTQALLDDEPIRRGGRPSVVSAFAGLIGSLVRRSC